MLQHLYGIHLAEDTDAANQALAALIEIWQDTPLVETLLEEGDEIFAFHDGSRVTNGRIEGTNKPARGAQTRRLRIRQRHQLRSQSTPRHPRHASITMTENRRTIPPHRADPEGDERAA